jgi:alpha-1,6-mannosyltransferase
MSSAAQTSAAPRAASRAAWLTAAGWLSVGAVVGACAYVAVGSASGAAIVDTAGAREPAWVAGALRGLAPALTLNAFGVALLVATAGYIGAFLLAERMPQRWLLAAVGAAIAAMLLAPPLLSSDIFGYIGYARLGTVHGLNPYLHAPDAVPGDPVFPLIYWQQQTTPYGPLFTLVSYALGPWTPAVALWGLKALAALCAFAATVLAARCAPRYGASPARTIAIIGLNPLLLIYAVGGGHNDPLAMLLLVLALALLAQERLGGIAALTAAAAVKIPSAIVLPYALVARRRERAAWLWAAGSALVAAVLSVLLFGSHILTQVTNIESGAAYLNDYSGPDLIGRLTGTGVTAGVRHVTLAAFAAVAVWQLARTWRGADWVAAAGWTTLAGLAIVPSVAPWYVCWLLPLAALGRSRPLRAMTFVFTLAMVLTYLTLIGRPPEP